jgi:hypothetical protein
MWANCSRTPSRAHTAGSKAPGVGANPGDGALEQQLVAGNVVGAELDETLSDPCEHDGGVLGGWVLGGWVLGGWRLGHEVSELGGRPRAVRLFVQTDGADRGTRG